MTRKTILILIVGFGLLPMWLALGAMVVMTLFYWNEMVAAEGGIALPLLLAAGFAGSWFTLGIAALTISVYVIVPGTPQRKKLLAGITCVARTLAGAGWVLAKEHIERRRAADATRDKVAAVDFVRNHPTSAPQLCLELFEFRADLLCTEQP